MRAVKCDKCRKIMVVPGDEYTTFVLEEHDQMPAVDEGIPDRLDFCEGCLKGFAMWLKGEYDAGDLSVKLAAEVLDLPTAAWVGPAGDTICPYCGVAWGHPMTHKTDCPFQLVLDVAREIFDGRTLPDPKELKT